MKKFFLLIIFIFFVLFCGCQIREELKQTGNRLAYVDNINILLTEDALPEIENLAFEFEKEKKDVHFKFIRIKDDEDYRSKVFDEVDSGKANAFYVHGFKDASFFKYLTKNFDINPYGDRAVIFDGTSVFKVGFYLSGLWANSYILNRYEIDETKITTMKRLKEFLNKLEEKFKHNKKHNKPKNTDIYSLVCSVGFKDGNISSYFDDMLKIIFGSCLFADKENVNKLLFSGDVVFYYGSSRDLNRYLLKKNSKFIKCLPVFFGNELFKILEEDYVCLSCNNSFRKTEQLLEFLNFASSRSYDMIKNEKDVRTSETYNMPFGFKKAFELHIKNFMCGRESFSNFKDKVKEEFDRCLLFDRSF